MIQVNTIRNYKNLVALIFATSILAVTACDIVCSIDRFSNNLSTTPHTMDGGQKHNHKNDHKHDGSHDHNASTKDFTEHSHASSSEDDEDDDCCKDITNQFYNSLFNSADIGVVKVPLHAFVLLTLLNNYHHVYSGSYRNLPTEIFAIPPNFRGNHLRIFIKSFLI